LPELAHDAVAGERRSEPLAHHALDRRVGGRHQRAVGLVPDLEAIVGEQPVLERRAADVRNENRHGATGYDVFRPNSVISTGACPSRGSIMIVLD